MSAKRNTILIGGGIVSALAILGLIIPIHGNGDPASKRQVSEVTLMSLLYAADAYRRDYGDWPPGDISEVVRTLSGDNSQKTVFLQLEPQVINPQGAPTDAWGTTFMLSFAGESVSAGSAGRDKAFGTPDDITLSK